MHYTLAVFSLDHWLSLALPSTWRRLSGHRCPGLVLWRWQSLEHRWRWREWSSPSQRWWREGCCLQANNGAFVSHNNNIHAWIYKFIQRLIGSCTACWQCMPSQLASCDPMAICRSQNNNGRWWIGRYSWRTKPATTGCEYGSARSSDHTYTTHNNGCSMKHCWDTVTKLWWIR